MIGLLFFILTGIVFLVGFLAFFFRTTKKFQSPIAQSNTPRTSPKGTPTPSSKEETPALHEAEKPKKKSVKPSKKTSHSHKFHTDSKNFVRNVPMITSTAHQFSWNTEGSKRHLALLIGDRLIKVYHIMKVYEDEKIVTIPTAPITTDYDLSAVALSPDGHTVAAAQSYDISIGIYSFSLAEQKFKLVKTTKPKLHKYPINSIYFLNNGEALCTTSTDDDLNVKVWSLDGEQLACIGTQQQKHYSSIANCTRNTLMVLAESPITKIFEAKFSHKELKTFHHCCSLGGNDHSVTEIALTPCGNAAASLAVKDSTLKLFDIKSLDYPKPIQVVSLNSLKNLEVGGWPVKIAVDYTQEGEIILAVMHSHQLSIYNISQNAQLIHHEEMAHTEGSSGIQIAAKVMVNELFVVTLASDSRVHLWRFPLYN